MGRQRQISDDEIKQIRSLYSQGKSSYRISKITGWNTCTIMFYIYEPKDRGRYANVDASQVAEMNRLYNDELLTYRELAERFPLSESSIGSYIWKPRKKGRPRKKDCSRKQPSKLSNNIITQGGY